jgi:MFS family permease
MKRMKRLGTAPHTGLRQWALLGFGVLGLATTATVLGFFLPVIINNLTDSRLAIGFAAGVEGLAALSVPLLVGQFSDRTWTRFGRRLPYMLAGTPLVFAGLLSVAVLHSYWLIVLAVALFFVGYYTYYTSYQALYPDTLPSNQYGRAWAYQSVFQGAGVALALIGGGALLDVNPGAPFLAAATFFVVVTVITAWYIRERKNVNRPERVGFFQALPNFLRRVRDDRNLRLFLSAHFCWEFTLAAIRAFVILYLLKGLDLSIDALLPVLVVIILAYLAASLISGYVADHFDPRDYLALMIVLYTGGMLMAGLTDDLAVLRLMMPFGMFAGAAVLMLAYPIMLRVTPADRRGEYTGYYQFNRGLALLIGTSLTGALIDRFGHYFPATGGYQVLWLVTAVVCLCSLPFYLRLAARTA